MKHLIKNSWIVITVLLMIFAVSSPGQKRPFPPIFLDQPAFPFDFTEQFYKLNGVDVAEVSNRRTGADGLSIIWKSNNTNQNDVRVLVTLPVYDHYGQIMFWYPLGDMTERAFLEDMTGMEARRLAEEFPIYVFPDKQIATFAGFADSRHAPLMDMTQAPTNNPRVNPLGLREIWLVRYTEKAFSGEGADLMAYMLKKNGVATDDTPILKTLADIRWMHKEGMLTLESYGYFPFAPYEGQFAVAPVIADPRYGAIAKDAFLLLAEKDGSPLPAEIPFQYQFTCLQTKGDWCYER